MECTFSHKTAHAQISQFKRPDSNNECQMICVTFFIEFFVHFGKIKLNLLCTKNKQKSYLELIINWTSYEGRTNKEFKLTTITSNCCEASKNRSVPRAALHTLSINLLPSLFRLFRKIIFLFLSVSHSVCMTCKN